MMTVPMGYDTWEDAIRSFVQARKENDTPDSVDPKVWNVFSLMALELLPEICA